MRTRLAPIDRILKRLQDREDEVVRCAYGSRIGETTDPRCTEYVTRRESTSLGHRDYCSHRHDALAQQDQIL